MKVLSNTTAELAVLVLRLLVLLLEYISKKKR